MDKKAVFDDFTDVVITVLVVIAILFVFNLYVAERETKVRTLLEGFNFDMQRDSFLLNYLRTPISETDFAKTRYPKLEAEEKEFAKQAIETNMKISDLYSFLSMKDIGVEVDNNMELLRQISLNDEFLVKQTIFIELPNRKQITIYDGCGEGETSVINIPNANGEQVSVFLRMCK